MKWLTRVGSILLKATQILVGITPVVGPIIPGDKDDRILAVAASELQLMLTVITQVELFGQALGIPGPDKLKAAAPAVAQIILSSAMMANRKIEDEVLFRAGCVKVADGMADIANSLKADIETISKT